jgi:hypothetical protein
MGKDGELQGCWKKKIQEYREPLPQNPPLQRNLSIRLNLIMPYRRLLRG